MSVDSTIVCLYAYINDIYINIYIHKSQNMNKQLVMS